LKEKTEWGRIDSYMKNPHFLKTTGTSKSAMVSAAAFLLAMPGFGQPGNAVPRPLKVLEAHMTITVDPEGNYDFADEGLANHTGRFSNTGSGVVDLVTGEFLSGTGTVIAANGDTLNWTVGTVDGTPNTVVYTGGTGRFEGLTGGFPAIITSVTPLSNNPDGTMTLAITYVGEGTIVY
jgi:hypothetical protein